MAKSLTLAVALILLSVGIVNAAPGKLDIAVYAASEFDGATTYIALQTCGNCYESNPLLRPYAQTPAIFPVMAVSAWAVNRIAKSLRPRHGRIAKALQISVVAIHVYAGANNLAR